MPNEVITNAIKSVLGDYASLEKIRALDEALRPIYGSEASQGCGYVLTKREWFAGQAIGAVIRQCAMDQAFALNGRSPEQYFAEKAFGIADAMLVMEAP